MLKPKKVITVVNCDFCGRDTPNKSRICRVCMAGQRNHKAQDFDTHDDAEGINMLFGYTDITRDDVISLTLERTMEDEVS